MLYAVFMISMMCCCVYWPCCCWLCGQCGRCLVPRPGARCLCGRGGGGRSDTVQAAELGIMMLARHRVNVSITSPTPTHHPRSHDGRSIRNDGCCQPDMRVMFNNHWALGVLGFWRRMTSKLGGCCCCCSCSCCWNLYQGFITWWLKMILVYFLCC